MRIRVQGEFVGCGGLSLHEGLGFRVQSEFIRDSRYTGVAHVLTVKMPKPQEFQTSCEVSHVMLEALNPELKYLGIRTCSIKS